MISSLTQTFGSNRHELFEFKSLDRQDMLFRSRLGQNVLAFHGSDRRFRDDVTASEFARSVDFTVADFDSSLPYPRTLETLFRELKRAGVRHVFYLQDDIFSLAKSELFDELLDFVSSQDFDMLSLEMTSQEVPVTPDDITWQGDRLQIYSTSSADFRAAGLFAMDPGAFVASVDFLIEHVFDDAYYSMPDLRSGRKYLSQKIEAKPIPRYCSNTRFYRRVNLFSSNLDRIAGYIFLRARFPDAKNHVLRALKAHIDRQDEFEACIEVLLGKIQERVTHAENDVDSGNPAEYLRGIREAGEIVTDTLTTALTDLKRTGAGAFR